MKKITSCIIALLMLAACQTDEPAPQPTPPQPSEPSACELISPLDDADEVIEPINFTWTKSEQPEGVVKQYKLLISEEGQNWETVTTQKTTSYRMNGKLKYPANYQWKVETVTEEGESATSSVRTFSTPGLYADGEVKQLLEAKKGKGVDIVITGDGFIKADLTHGGAFEKAAQRIVNNLDQVEPYKTYKEYFNVYCLFALSKERGADYDESLTQLRDTKFNTRFDKNSMSSTFIDADKDKIFQFFEQKLGRRTIDETLIITMVNAKRKSGYCHFWMQGRAIAFCPVADQPPGDWFEKCVTHEGFGHGFAKLGDEYLVGSQKESEIPKTSSDWKNLSIGLEKGAFFNISTTGSPEDLKWKELIDRDDERYDCVGAFEGAFYWGKGVWRSENTSCMINNIKYFNAPSRYAIVKRIKFLAGETEPTIAEFKEKDRQLNRPHQNEKIPLAAYSSSMRAQAWLDNDLKPNDPPTVYFD